MPVNKTRIALALALALLVSAPAVQAQEATPGYDQPQPGTAAAIDDTWSSSSRLPMPAFLRFSATSHSNWNR